MLKFYLFLGHSINTEQTMGARRIDLPLPRGIHDAEYVIKVSKRPGLSGHHAVIAKPLLPMCPVSTAIRKPNVIILFVD